MIDILKSKKGDKTAVFFFPKFSAKQNYTIHPKMELVPKPEQAIYKVLYINGDVINKIFPVE